MDNIIRDINSTNLSERGTTGISLTGSCGAWLGQQGNFSLSSPSHEGARTSSKSSSDPHSLNYSFSATQATLVYHTAKLRSISPPEHPLVSKVNTVKDLEVKLKGVKVGMIGITPIGGMFLPLSPPSLPL